MSQASRFLGNFAAVIVLGLGLAYLTDRLWLWFGWHPWAFCGLLPALETVGRTATVIVAMVSAIVFLASLMKNGAAGILFLGAVVLSSMPGLFSHYLGAYCTADGRLTETPPRNAPAGR